MRLPHNEGTGAPTQVWQTDVSVVVAARNEEKHLREALESLLVQEDVRHEVVFVDDNSTDGTWAIAQALAAEHAHLKIHQNPRQGKCSAFNHGVSLAAGRFVCIFAGDDVMPQGSLGARWQAVKHLPDDTPGVGLSKLRTMSEMPRFDGHLIPKKAGRGALSGVSPLMNRAALDIVFPVPESLPNEDTWMELAVLHLAGWNIVHSDIVCCHWRVHSGNSINMAMPFAEFNRKFTVRMAALKLFQDAFADRLSAEGRRDLAAKVDCEAFRTQGNMMGILKSSAGWVDKLRALSYCNSTMYDVRRRLYGLLSGW